MTKSKEHKTKLLAVEAVAGDRDRMKALMKEALQEVLEGEMSEFLGAAPGEHRRKAARVTVQLTTAAASSPGSASWRCVCRGTIVANSRPTCSTAICPVPDDYIAPSRSPLFFARDGLRTLIAEMEAENKSSMRSSPNGGESSSC
jgi:hypothetical protein